MNELLQKSPEEMAGLQFSCSCGKTHSIDIKGVRIGSNILSDIRNYLKEFEKGTLLFIADSNTYEAGGREVESILSEDFKLEKVIFPNPHLHPDEEALGQLQGAMNSNIKAIVVVGSGTLNDLVRYLSYETKIPYVVVCTAPSMDGYASMVSPLITKGVKVTYDAVYPYSIIADLSIMKEAPFHMLHAGLGDIVGKYSALADWKLANILHGEYYCEITAQLVEKAVQQCVDSASGIMARSPESIRSIIEGLILSGMCIGMTGSSRPASGEEHLLSHTWEMLGLIRKQETHLHGNQVGIGTEIILHIYQYLLTLDIDKVYADGKFRSFTREKWEQNIKSLFGNVAPQIIQKKAPFINFTAAKREKAAQHIVQKWDELKTNVFLTMPSPISYLKMMEEAGSKLTPLDLKLDRESFRLSLLTAKEIRQRFGVMQILEDLGILEETVERITDFYYS
ncbi:sn-glycerol-1-phosphate dehydrogenase [Pelosinus sp. UFO1]|uniref:sn-glycerol-1-phosphate dehydrogenase n=1 Tax=Pelosinus sp. UFO1 TaxID=484770 RepID=UPI0004D18A7F|nr:sn-glycerol-1-phosphate dehydrogenase [Pelosinus sp. UFO1]AIF54041.1 Glycerol-1-phosphate dehydrogenase (NAD(P)(+)) [Pelosinus sp. UFO1]